MNAPEAFLLVWTGFCIASLCFLFIEGLARGLKSINRRLRNAIARRRAKGLAADLATALAPTPTPAPPPAAAPPVPQDGWFAVIGGTRLEYKASGFAIELHPENPAPYSLLTPEGRTLAASPSLFMLKMLGAQCAAERAEFSPATKGGAA